MTENPFSTQGWNRYSYVGNSPVNFTDPSGYCFLGCCWKPIFKAIGNFLKKSWKAIVQIAATALICGPAAPVCAGLVSAAVTGITSGSLGMALKAGLISMVTSMAMEGIASAAGLTSGGGFGQTTTVEHASSWQSFGQMMHAGQQPPTLGTQLPPLCVGDCGASSVGQSLAQGTMNLVPGASYGNLASQALSGGSYIKAAGYFTVAMLDAGIAVFPLTAVAAAGINVTSRAVKAVAAYEVGAFNGLRARSVVGDGLDLHHAMQAHPARQVIPGYDRLRPRLLRCPRWS